MNAIILAGGKNSRIGTRKALLEIDGKRILQRTIETLTPYFDKLILVTNEADIYSGFDLPMVSDEIEGQGPLGGIHAGLGASDAALNFVVACDMPFLDNRIVEFLSAQVAAIEARCIQVGNHFPYCVVPRWEKGIEPLHAFYHQSVRKRIPETVNQGERKLGYLVRKWGGAFVDMDQWALQHQIDLVRAFSNVNTWDEFDQAKQLVE